MWIFFGSVSSSLFFYSEYGIFILKMQKKEIVYMYIRYIFIYVIRITSKHLYNMYHTHTQKKLKVTNFNFKLNYN